MSEAAPVLVAFARPEESRAFRRRIAEYRRERRAGTVAGWGKVGATQVCVAHVGIGPESAQKAMRPLIDSQRWQMVVSAGFAGALDPKLRLGDTLVEEVAPQASRRRVISTELPVETAEAKRALHARTAAQAVDMETDAVARVCAGHSVPVLAVRVISDTAEADLPVPFAEWFHLERQRPRPFRLLSYLARHPKRVPAFVRFVREIPRLSEALALAVEGSIVGLEHI